MEPTDRVEIQESAIAGSLIMHNDMAENSANRAGKAYHLSSSDDEYWKDVYGPVTSAEKYGDESSDYDIDIYWVDRPANLRLRNKRLKHVCRRLKREYEVRLAESNEELISGQKFPVFLYEEKWGLIRSQIPLRNGESPIVKLPMEILQNIFRKMFCLLELDYYRKSGVSNVALVCSQFYEAVKPILYGRLSIFKDHSMEYLARLLERDMSIGPFVKILHFRFECASHSKATEISRDLLRIFKQTPNLQTVSANMEGQNGVMVIPTMKDATTSKYEFSVRNLKLLFGDYTVPFTVFAQRFNNLSVIHLSRVDMRKMKVTPVDLQTRLDSVQWLQLESSKIGEAGIALLSSALGNVKGVTASIMTDEVIDLLERLAAEHDILRYVKLFKCKEEAKPIRFSRRLWEMLESVELRWSALLSAEMFPGKEIEISYLPRLKNLVVLAEIKLPARTQDLDRLLIAVNELPRIVSKSSGIWISKEDPNALPSGVNVSVICDTCPAFDVFGEMARNPRHKRRNGEKDRYISMPSYLHCTILDTVGTVEEPRVWRMDSKTRDRFKMDLGTLWANDRAGNGQWW
ncbi:uncharacterized protein V1516DRAFT_677697 [Lipomyces oligophaga]|uniref:uncharacterized protein n=1 Tax=Lipomyces oligophaga TaxID=45792 RepID=UPI0034CFA9E9